MMPNNTIIKITIIIKIKIFLHTYPSASTAGGSGRPVKKLYRACTCSRDNIGSTDSIDRREEEETTITSSSSFLSSTISDLLLAPPRSSKEPAGKPSSVFSGATADETISDFFFFFFCLLSPPPAGDGSVLSTLAVAAPLVLWSWCPFDSFATSLLFSGVEVSYIHKTDNKSW